MKARDKAGESEYQLLLECRSNARQKRRGKCVCVCVRRGQWVLSSVQAAPCQRCIEFGVGKLGTVDLNIS